MLPASETLERLQAASSEVATHDSGHSFCKALRLEASLQEKIGVSACDKRWISTFICRTPHLKSSIAVLSPRLK